MGLFPFNERKQQFVSSIMLLFCFNFCHPEYCTSQILTCTYVILSNKQKIMQEFHFHILKQTWKSFGCLWSCFVSFLDRRKRWLLGRELLKIQKMTVCPNFYLNYFTMIFPAHSSLQHYLTFHYLAAAMTYQYFVSTSGGNSNTTK